MTANISQLSDLTGMARKTVVNRLDGMPFSGGTFNGDPKLYDSVAALARLYAIEQGVQGGLTNAQAASELSQAKRMDIELDMEIKRKERIPLAVIGAVNDEAITAVIGMIKKYVGKTVTENDVAEILSELRAVGARIKTP